MSSIYSQQPPGQQEQRAFTVSELNRDVKLLLEQNFPAVLVEGEISNFSRPASGHWYFTLKDEAAQVRCAMFRSRNMAVRFKPEPGAMVRLRARLSLYEGRGDYQLLVDRMEAAGDGALQRAFEELKLRLQNEGLFAEERKQPIPQTVRHVAVITSATGAAIRDVLSVFRRRFPAIRITILPVPVQGREAAPAIVRAIDTAGQKRGPLADIDVLLLTRGGGSLEDLWPFNEEAVARKVADCAIPVVSAVGHEVDFTITDFVADIRAATPSAAAELLSPSQDDYRALSVAYAQQLTGLMRRNLNTGQQTLASLLRRLRHPGRRLEEQAQRLDELEKRLQSGLTNTVFRNRSRLLQLLSALKLHSPQNRLQKFSSDRLNLERQLISLTANLLERKRHRLEQQVHALNTVSPLATLARGYAIALDDKGQVLTSIDQVAAGDEVTTRLENGSFTSSVNRVDRLDQ